MKFFIIQKQRRRRKKAIHNRFDERVRSTIKAVKQIIVFFFSFVTSLYTLRIHRAVNSLLPFFNLRPPVLSINQNRRANSDLGAKKGGDWMGGISPSPLLFSFRTIADTPTTPLLICKRSTAVFFLCYYFFFHLIIFLDKKVPVIARLSLLSLKD